MLQPQRILINDGNIAEKKGETYKRLSEFAPDEPQPLSEIRVAQSPGAPAVLAGLGGDPNSSRTLPFISDSALRGAVARALGDPSRPTEELVKRIDAVRARGARRQAPGQ